MPPKATLVMYTAAQLHAKQTPLRSTYVSVRVAQQQDMTLIDQTGHQDEVIVDGSNCPPRRSRTVGCSRATTATIARGGPHRQ